MKQIILSCLALGTVASFAAPPAIPYNIACDGRAGNQVLQLTTKASEELTLSRSLSGDSMVIDFRVDDISSLNGFVVKTTGMVAFAGSGTMTGELNLPDGRNGTWTERTAVFNEATGQMENGEISYNVSCQIAQ